MLGVGGLVFLLTLPVLEVEHCAHRDQRSLNSDFLSSSQGVQGSDKEHLLFFPLWQSLSAMSSRNRGMSFPLKSLFAPVSATHASARW